LIKPMQRAVTDTNLENRSIAARDLAALWRRIRSQHLSATQGCACGFGGLMIQTSDFEIDIVEFVIGDARRSGQPSIERYIEAVARRGGDHYSLPALLDAVGKAGDGAEVSRDELDFILTRLRTSLTSIDAAHTSSRFACD
jgi:hypothetical protein